MDDLTGILVDLFLLFAAARLAGEIFLRLRQPAIVGEVLAGVLIGPHALGLVGVPDSELINLLGDKQAAEATLDIVFDVIAGLGVIILLFYVGLETRLDDLAQVWRRASAVGVLGILFPFAFGFAFIWATGRSNLESAFVATTLVATSVGITARVLSDMGAIRSQEARIILGAAVLDDILSLLLLAVVKGFAGDDLDVSEVGFTALAAVVFVVFAALVGTRVVRRYSIHFERLRLRNAPLLVAIAIMLGFSALAGVVGLAAIIGAFLAGMMLAEADERYNLEQQALPLYELLVPFFFVITGARVELDAFADLEVLGIALAVTSLAILGKVVGGSMAMLGAGRSSALLVGLGMVPRGEVGLVAASVGAGIGAISSDIFSVVVFMSIATTLIAPPLLQILLRGRYRHPAQEPTVLEGRGLPDL